MQGLPRHVPSAEKVAERSSIAKRADVFVSPFFLGLICIKRFDARCQKLSFASGEAAL
jgi:hypothetical protein